MALPTQADGRAFATLTGLRSISSLPPKERPVGGTSARCLSPALYSLFRRSSR